MLNSTCELIVLLMSYFLFLPVLNREGVGVRTKKASGLSG